MADNDGSRRFLLKGGKRDAHRNKKKTAGFKLRIYPEKRAEGYYIDKSFTVTTPAVWADEVEYDGEAYGFPAEQNWSAPYLEFLRKVEDEQQAV